MNKTVLFIKDKTIKAKFMPSHLVSFHFLSCQTASKINQSIALISSILKSVTSCLSPQIIIDLSQYKHEFLQKYFAKIWQIFYISISSSQRTEGIKRKKYEQKY